MGQVVIQVLLLLHLFLHTAQGNVRGGDGDDAGEVTNITVRAHIEHRYATTLVSTTIYNPRPRPSRLSLHLGLPQSALISGFVIEAGGRNYSGRVYDRASATSVSEATKQGGKTTALLQLGEEDVQRVTVRAKVPALRSYTFHVTYEELVSRVNGSYIYTLHINPGQRAPRVEINLRVLEQEEIQDYRILKLPGQEMTLPLPGSSVTADPASPRELHVKYHHEDHPKGPARGVDGTFIFCYTTTPHSDGGELQRVGNYFAHYFSPEPLPVLRTHTVYVLDVSHSMQDTGLPHVKALLPDILPMAHKEDSFEILVFSSDVVSLGTFNGKRKSVKRAVRRVKKLEAFGDSNLDSGLIQALKNAANSKGKQPLKQIVVFSDGQSTSGTMNPSHIRKNVQEANIEQMPIYSFVFGDGSNKLLEHISLDSQGFAQVAEPSSSLDSQLRAFLQRITSPVVAGVDVNYSGADPDSLAQAGTKNYYLGGELVLVGKVSPGSHACPNVTGRVGTGLTEFPLTRTNYRDTASSHKSSIARLWAYLKVQDLLTKAESAQSLNLTRHFRTQALQLAQQSNFVTRVTSMVAVYPGASLLLTRPGSLRPQNNLHLPQHDQPGGPQEIAAAFSGSRRASRSYMQGNMPHAYVDLDPHFLVRAQGLNLPLCFNFISPSGSFVSLIRDPQSGIILNGELASAARRPSKTYFSHLFLSLGSVNITISPQHIQVDCLQDDGTPQVSSITNSLWPYYRKNGRRYRYKEDRQLKRKKSRRAKTRVTNKTRVANNLSNNVASDNSYYHYNGNHRPTVSTRTNVEESIEASCRTNTTWEAGIGRNYGDVMVVMSKKQRLQLSLGDGLAHLTVLRSKNKQYLGLSIKQQQVLSSEAQGIIGHLTFKSVKLVSGRRQGGGGSSKKRVQLEVNESNTGGRLVSGMVVRRHSLLVRTHITCISIGEPDTLLDRPPGKYLVECLTC